MPHVKSGKIALRPRRNLVATLVTDLRSQIEAGHFQPGEKLPSEARLTDRFSVSRTVVREAIATLRADGLVEPRQGAGVFVLGPTPDIPRPFAMLDTANIPSIVEMLEVRIAVESEAAALAAARISPAQEEEIYDAEQEIRILTTSGRSTTEADLRFHLAIADATNNPRFREFLEAMGPAVIPRAALKEDRSAEAYITLISAEHRAIADAITAGNPDAARDAMRKHLQGSRDRYRGLLRQKSDRIAK